LNAKVIPLPHKKTSIRNQHTDSFSSPLLLREHMPHTTWERERERERERESNEGFLLAMSGDPLTKESS
jgi:hypothetical protein